MKKRKITIALFAVVSGMILNDSLNNYVFTYSGGAPAGRTGSPGDGASCSCHGTPVAKTGWITSDIPTAGYTPGTTYTISATCTNANQSKFGFEISPQDNAGTLLGTLIASNTTETQLIGSGKYITNTSSGNSGSGSKTWSFKWTSPKAGTGTVTFYGSFVGGYSNVFSSTLQVKENTCTPPTATITAGGATTFCQGGSVVLTAGTGSGYLWSNGATTQSITVTSAGNYDVTVGSGGCTAKSASTTVTVKPLPAKPTITQTGDSLICSSAQTYQWLLNKTAVSNATSKTVVPKTSGYYSVSITDANGCINTSDSIYVTVTEIETFSSLNNFSVFPNPFNNKTSVNYSLAVSSWVTIEVYNLLGEKMRTLVNEHQTRGNFYYNVFANELGTGVYFVKCKVNEEARIMKLIVAE